MSGRRVTSLGLIALLVAWLSACTPHRLSANVGVTPSARGTARILFVHCMDQGVTGVSLARFTLRTGSGRSLWRLRASVPSAATLFTIGVTPIGFQTIIPFERALPPARPLLAQVRTTAGPYSVGFRALDLLPGSVSRPAADMVSKPEFVDQACT
jgi:hypothetical protein